LGSDEGVACVYKVIGLEASLRNVLNLERPFLEGTGRRNLCRAFRSFLQTRYPNVAISGEPEIALLADKVDIRSYLEIFEIDSVLDDFHAFFDEGVRSHALLLRIKDGMQQIAAHSPQFVALLELVIHTIFTAPSSVAGGGSTSALIGCIWADLRPYWGDQDIQEFLIHETTHNLIFLDELCHGHYSDYHALSDHHNFAQSAIFSRPRPLDKVLHSILVSVEILLFREHQLGHPCRPYLHPPTEILLEQTRAAIHSVLNMRGAQNLLTTRAYFLLEESQQALNSIFLKIFDGV